MTDEMILVPRAELLAWAKVWENALGPNDGTDCVTPFDAYLLKPPVNAQSTVHVEVLRHMKGTIKAIMPSEVAALDAAIASLSAPQPPAEAQAQVGGEVAYFRKEMIARCREYAAGMVDIGADHHDLEAALAPLLGTAPPSAPVGVPVDVVREYLDARACYEAATRPPNSHARAPVLKHDDPDALRLREARVALDNAIVLAQQPAAVDEASPYPTPRNRQEAAALAKLALAYLGVTSAHIDAVVARCETDLAAQQGGGAS